MKQLDLDKLEMKFWESVYKNVSSDSEDAVIRLDDLGKIVDKLFIKIERRG